MRERIHAFGGDLRTGPSADGIGFLVAATLPITPPITPPAREADGHG
jgi:hypothetical protein